MKRFSLLLALLVVGLTTIVADDTPVAVPESSVFDRFPAALGAQGVLALDTNTFLGGLSWQYWFGPIGLQVSGGGLVASDSSYNYNVFGSTQFRMYGADFNQWFSGALYGNVLLGHSGSGGASLAYVPRLHAGVGIGIELVFLEHLSPSVEFQYVSSIPLAGGEAFNLGFGLGFSLRYRF